ncbi:MAG: hypothetical protein ACM3KD_03700 [Hyphomicrobiaceae bacterium]
MELSSELIEIDPEKESNVLTRHFAKVFVACVFVLLVGMIAFVLAAGFHL